MSDDRFWDRQKYVSLTESPRNWDQLRKRRGIPVIIGNGDADKVVVNYEGDDAANAAAGKTRRTGSNAIAHKADVSTEDEAAEMFDGEHELDNLYLADARFFPSVAGVNPKLSNALRVADRVKERLL